MVAAIITFAVIFRVVGNIACAVLAYLISRLPYTPTYTYRLIMWGWVAVLIPNVVSVVYISQIATFATDFAGILVFTTQIFQTIGVFLLFYGKARIYYDLRNKLKGEQEEKHEHK